MLAVATGALIASSAYVAGLARPAVQVRATGAQMADISAFDDVWGIEAKTAIFNAWNPDAPRDYDNFNPFERNDEGAQCDFNGCFPGQSKGYKSPKRPDTSWAIMQEEAAAMEELKKDPKYDTTGKPGNWFRKWQ